MRARILLAACLATGAVLLTSCSGAEPPPAPVTVTKEVPVPAAAPVTPASVEPVPVVIPDVEGQNLQLVAEQLDDLGLTNWLPASQDVEDKFPLFLPNWTVVSIEPGPGETVLSTDSVVVTATKTG